MKKAYQSVCVTEALYPLMFYLFIRTPEEINKTLFIVDRRIHKKIICKLPNVYFENIDSFRRRHRWLLLLYGYWLRFVKLQINNNTEFFGLDFKWYLLNGHDLNYIEDAPNVFNLWETGPMYRHYLEAQNINKWKRILRKLIFGAYFRCPVATSDGVKCVYTTASYNKPYLKDKKIVVVDLKNEWEKSSDEKKKLILSIFDISNSDLDELRKKKVMLLTQAFYDDNMVSEKEQIEIYRKILDNYDHNEVVIKAHPRDKLDYNKAFPDVMYFNKTVPLQFLSIIGLNFTHVATVSSSSALSFGDEIQIDWYGGGVHPNILKAEGLRTLEDALKNYCEQYKK